MIRAVRHLPVVAALAFAGGVDGPRAGGSSCTFREAKTRWIQRALDGWDLVRADHLRLEPEPLPWIVLFDASCIWHVQPGDARLVAEADRIDTDLSFDSRPLDIRALQHAGTVLLPNRVEIPAEVRASTALYSSGRATFLALSMPPLWRAALAHARHPHLEDYLAGVFAHEMAHSRHLVGINRRLRRLTGSGEIPARVNDDVVQIRFQREAGFTRAMETERDMYFRAAAEPDPVRQRHLAAAALSLRRARHGRFFTGANSAYAEIETLFFTLEGAGQWAAWRLTRARGPFAGRDADALKLVRDNRRFWSQDAGLAVFLLLDALVPAWQPAIFAPDPASPFELIGGALGLDNGGDGRNGEELTTEQRR